MKRIFAVIIVLALCITTFVTPASAYSLPDLSKKCAITIEMRYGSSAIRNMRITIYRVADAEIAGGASLKFPLTSDFSGSGINFADMDSGSKNLEFSNTLKRYISDHNILGTPDSTNSSGKVTFSDLSAGMYLVVPTSVSGYYTPSPYLIMLPQTDADGIWLYSIAARPKTEISPVPPPPPVDPPPRDPPPRDPPPRDPPTTTPPPPTTSTPPPTTSIPPRGSYEEILPEKVPMGNEELWTIDPEEIPTGPGDLPQTGVLRWPIPVLSISGLLLFSFGWVMTGKEKKSDEE